MTSEMKYVVFYSHKGEQIIIFPKIIQHSVMADDVEKSSFGGMRAISGGFIVNGECVGESESLRMKSRGDEDTKLIDKLLDLDVYEETRFPVVEFTKSTINKNKAKRLRKKSKSDKGQTIGNSNTRITKSSTFSNDGTIKS